MKRIMIIALLAGTAAVGGAASAGCPGASAGHRGGATVPAVEVDGTRTVTVTIDARWVDACDDASIIASELPILGAETRLTITGDQSCETTTTSDWDPFGFAVGVHDDTTAKPDCSIDITWSGFLNVFTPDPARSGPTEDGDGVRATLSKATNHENGIVMVDGTEYRAHGAAIGVMWTGAGGDA